MTPVELLASLDDAESMDADALRDSIVLSLGHADRTDLIHLAKPLRVILARVAGVGLSKRTPCPFGLEAPKATEKSREKPRRDRKQGGRSAGREMLDHDED